MSELPDCMIGPSEPCAGFATLTRQLEEALAQLAERTRERDEALDRIDNPMSGLTRGISVWRTRAESAEAALAEARGDAERWTTLCELWAASTELSLTQDEDGRWSITQVEDVDGERFARLTGDDPDAAIDAAIAAGREG